MRWSTTVLSWRTLWPAWRCWPRRWSRSWPPWSTPSGVLRGHHALQRINRARPPVRPWWPGPPPLLGAQLPAPARCCPALRLGGDSVVQGLDGSRVVAGGCRVHRQVSYLSVGRQSEGQLCAVSYLSVVQDLRDVARDRSFKHVFLGVGVTRIRNAWVLYFRNAPSLKSLWVIRAFVAQGCIIIYQPAPPVREVRSFTYETSDELTDGVGQSA